MSTVDRDEGGRDEDGRFTPTVTDDALLTAIESAGAPVLTTPELADRLPIGRRAIRERLLDLEARGKVARKTVGARAVVWWTVDNECDDTPDELYRDLEEREDASFGR